MTARLAPAPVPCGATAARMAVKGIAARRSTPNQPRRYARAICRGSLITLCPIRTLMVNPASMSSAYSATNTQYRPSSTSLPKVRRQEMTIDEARIVTVATTSQTTRAALPTAITMSFRGVSCIAPSVLEYRPPRG